MEDWREHAACNGMDTDLWFPVSETPKTQQQLRQIRIAKNTCKACPVRMDCLLYALTTSQRHGIWGGMTESERRRPRARAIRDQALATA